MIGNRKLSQLLPIARKHLISLEHPREVQGMYDQFTCYAARVAWENLEITRKEYDALRDAIMEELAVQSQNYGMSYCGCLINLLTYKHPEVFKMFPHSPKYFPYRDAWLDEFQARLEKQENEQE
jgi:hypothetical protein